jgi:hypothetical protein
LDLQLPFLCGLTVLTVLILGLCSCVLGFGKYQSVFYLTGNLAEQLNKRWACLQQWDCFYAGRRINSHLFVRYQQWFWLMDFFSTFVRNLNFNKLIGLTVGLDEH